jgi:hypothetical protein
MGVKLNLIRFLGHPPSSIHLKIRRTVVEPQKKNRRPVSNVEGIVEEQNPFRFDLGLDTANLASQ